MASVSKLREAFDAIRAMALAAQTTYDEVQVGSLPPADSMVMLIAAGAEKTATLDHRGDLTVDIVCNVKHKYQMVAIDVLATVHNELTSATNRPSRDGWQVLSLSSSSLPTFIEKDGDQFLYGSGFNAKIWIK